MLLFLIFFSHMFTFCFAIMFLHAMSILFFFFPHCMNMYYSLLFSIDKKEYAIIKN